MKVQGERNSITDDAWWQVSKHGDDMTMVLSLTQPWIVNNTKDLAIDGDPSPTIEDTETDE